MIQELEKAIGYQFKNIALLENALSIPPMPTSAGTTA